MTTQTTPRPTSELVKEVLRYANDRVWANHAEVPKGLLEEAAASLQALEDENTHFRAAYNNTVGSLNEAEGRADDLEARNKELEGVLERQRDGWMNVLELRLLPPQHTLSAAILSAEATAALHPATKTEGR